MSLSEYQSNSLAFTVARAKQSGALSVDQAATLDHLATLAPLEYGRQRKGIAEQLDVPVKYLDQEIEHRRSQTASGIASGSGQPLKLENIEPADDPVNGVRMLATLVETLGRFVVLPPHAALAVALWIVRAYVDELFDTNPRLALLSPEKRCGKTTLLELIAKLVPRSLATSNVTSSVIYRTIEAAHPTLLIDEMDAFTDAHEELRGILNSGHRRETARVIRNVGDDHEPRSFSTWCPMVLAAIGRLPGTLEDRSIIVPMRRRAPGERVTPLRWASKAGEGVRAQLRIMARAIARWTFDHGHELKNTVPTLPTELHDRAADNWSPLLTIAEVIGGDWAEQARQAAVSLSGPSTVESESKGIQLLADIREAFEATGVDRFASQVLCDRLTQLEERPWADWRHGKPLSTNQLARLLRPFAIVSRNIRFNDQGVLKGYLYEACAEAFRRYLPEISTSDRYTATSLSQSGDQPLFQSATASLCSVSENGPNPALDAGSSAVAVQDRETEGAEDIFEEDHALEAIDHRIRYHRANGHIVYLEPGKPVEFPDQQARKILQRARGKVRPLICGKRLVPGRLVSWRAATGHVLGPVTVDFVHIDDTGTMWAFVTYQGNWRAVSETIIVSIEPPNGGFSGA